MAEFNVGDKAIWELLQTPREVTILSGPWTVKELGGESYVIDDGNVNLISVQYLKPVERWETRDVPLEQIRFEYGDGAVEHRRNVVKLEIRVE